MKHFAVYDKVTGQLVSTGTENSEDLPDSLAVADGWEGEEWEAPENVPGLQWNSGLRRFVRSTLTVSPVHIPGDGSALSTAIFKTDNLDPVNTVEFDVNGAKTVVSVTNGVAEIDIRPTTPGDTITVRVDVDPGLVATIGVDNATNG